MRRPRRRRNHRSSSEEEESSSSSSEEESSYDESDFSSPYDISHHESHVSYESSFQRSSDESEQLSLPKPPPPKNKYRRDKHQHQRSPARTDREELMKKNKKTLNTRSCSGKSGSTIRFESNTKTPESNHHQRDNNSSPSSSCSNSYNRRRLSSNVESHRINNSEDFYDMQSSSQESYPESTSSGEKYYLHSNDSSISSYDRRKRKRKRKFESTIRSSISVRASSVMQTMKRPDHIFLFMALGIFSICTVLAYFFVVRKWTSGGNNKMNNGQTADFAEETLVPSLMPSFQPSLKSKYLIKEFTTKNTPIPSSNPTTYAMSTNPSMVSSNNPSDNPSDNTSDNISDNPSHNPSVSPTTSPSLIPSQSPTISRSIYPTIISSSSPSTSTKPSVSPTITPSSFATGSPSISHLPSISLQPSFSPTKKSCYCTPQIYRWKLNFTKDGCPLEISNTNGIKNTPHCTYEVDPDQQDRDGDDFKPLLVNNITFIEVFPETGMVNEQVLHEVLLLDGDYIQYESLTNVGYQSPGSLKCQITAINAKGAFDLVIGVEFSNTCEEVPFKTGDSLGWLEFTEDSKIDQSSCFYNTVAPSQSPTSSFTPSTLPSSIPTQTISVQPSAIPSSIPSLNISIQPTNVHSQRPSSLPSNQISSQPSQTKPTFSPSLSSSNIPSQRPSQEPSKTISSEPSLIPSTLPHKWGTLVLPILGPSNERDFANAIAISGNGSSIAVGHHSEDKVFVYDMENDQWTLRGNEAISGPPFSRFGAALAISNDGNTVVVGGLAALNDKGVVEVWRWKDSYWDQLGSQIYGENEDDDFGITVDISRDGNCIIVGSADRQSNEDRGSVLVFKYDESENEWIQKGDTIYGDNPRDDFGATLGAVSITENGEAFAVGAYFADYVKVYSWNGIEWQQIGATIHSYTGNQSFGSIVQITSMSESYHEYILAVTSLKDDPNGSIYIFDWSNMGNSWEERNEIRLGYTNSFGYQLSMTPDGNTVLTVTDDSVVVFDWKGSSWVQRGGEVLRVDGDGVESRTRIVTDISNDGKRVVAGLPKDDDGLFIGTNNGQVRSFVWQRDE